MKRLFYIAFFFFISNVGISQTKKQIDSLVSTINASKLTIRKTITPDTSMRYSIYFQEDYFVNEDNELVKVKDFQGGNVSSTTYYYFLNNQLIKVESGLSKGDTILAKANYYFINGRPIIENRKQKNRFSYYIGKSESILRTFKE